MIPETDAVPFYTDDSYGDSCLLTSVFEPESSSYQPFEDFGLKHMVIPFYILFDGTRRFRNSPQYDDFTTAEKAGMYLSYGFFELGFDGIRLMVVSSLFFSGNLL
ncbi:MAG: hypothetical protein KAJ88_04270 [Candidatus Aenigmarchaeota archaeon]|nr:hypothetical protein [Candidatus Aenigmarchaeota archaeon]